MTDYREIAEFYDHEYADLDYLGPDVDFFLDHCPGERVIEIGCGTGRATVELAEAGREVVGLDIDPTLLAIAKGKGGTATYVEADAADESWPQRSGGGFDVACCFFNTFLALAEAEEQEACLRACHASLKPGGKLWLDLFNPNLDLIVQSVGGADELEPDLFVLPDGRSVLRTTSLYADLVRQVSSVTFSYVWYSDGDRQERHRTFDMAWIMPRELDRLLRMTGFEIDRVWGDHDGSDFDEDSERQIVLATRI